MTISKVQDLSDVTGDHLGCWIDGSQMPSWEFDIKLVETAIHFGFVIDHNDWEELKAEIYSPYNFTPSEDIYYIAEVAYHWFNELLPQGYYFHIEDNSLILLHEDMELINE